MTIKHLREKMKRIGKLNTTFITTFLTGVIVLPGCSSPPEDVRLTLCKSLVTTLTESPETVIWKENENKMARFENLEMKLQFEAQQQDGSIAPMHATCFYEYDEAIEEDIFTHTDPLSAYKTLPYEMTLNGQPVPKPVLSKNINTAMLKQGKEFADRVQKEIKDTAQKIKNVAQGKKASEY